MSYQIIQADHLHSISITVPLLNPAEAEIHFTFHLEEEVHRPELRGRLMGPRCPYASTVEIAYPLRPLPRMEQASARTITGRVIIPEPSYWDPVAPNLYQGPLELWAGGKPLVQLQVSHGLRVLQGGSKGLRWNGKPAFLQGLAVEQAGEAQAYQWRQAGYNTWLITGNEQAGALCTLADRYGFFVLVKAEDFSDLAALGEHACCLGWIVPGEMLQDDNRRKQILSFTSSRKQLLGLEVTDRITPETISGLSFLVGEPDRLSSLASELPRLFQIGKTAEASAPAEGLLGYIHLQG